MPFKEKKQSHFCQFTLQSIINRTKMRCIHQRKESRSHGTINYASCLHQRTKSLLKLQQTEIPAAFSTKKQSLFSCQFLHLQLRANSIQNSNAPAKNTTYACIEKQNQRQNQINRNNQELLHPHSRGYKENMCRSITTGKHESNPTHRKTCTSNHQPSRNNRKHRARHLQTTNNHRKLADQCLDSWLSELPFRDDDERNTHADYTCATSAAPASTTPATSAIATS